MKKRGKKAYEGDIIGWKVGWKGFGRSYGSTKPPKANIIDYIAFLFAFAGIVLSFAGLYMKMLFLFGILLLFISLFTELASLLIGRLKRRN